MSRRDPLAQRRLIEVINGPREVPEKLMQAYEEQSESRGQRRQRSQGLKRSDQQCGRKKLTFTGTRAAMRWDKNPPARLPAPPIAIATPISAGLRPKI